MCQHHWIVSTPTKGEHEIGVCTNCGDTIDFSILQEQDKGWRQICLANTLTRPDVDMSRIMAVKKPKGRQSKYSRGRVR